MGFFHQGKPLPKTEQKFENFVKSSFKITDKKVSGWLVLSAGMVTVVGAFSCLNCNTCCSQLERTVVKKSPVLHGVEKLMKV